MDLGATRWQAVRMVLVPCAVAIGPSRPGCSPSPSRFDDFVLSTSTTGDTLQPLPVRIWSAIRFGVTPD